MSLQIFNAHTGQRLLADAGSFSSLDSFKTWLGQASAVAPPQQILLTSAGKQAKFPALAAESELFLYNRQLVSPSPSSSGKRLSVPSIPQPHALVPSPVPDSSIDQTDLQAWQKLFEARRDWARDLLVKSRSLHDDAQVHLEAVVAIERGVGVAAGNLQSHVRTLEQKFGEAGIWSEQLAQEQETLLTRYDTLKPQLQHLPAKPAVLRLLPRLRIPAGNAGPGQHLESTSLATFVDDGVVDEVANTVQQTTIWVTERIKILKGAVDKVVGTADDLVESINRAQAISVEESTREVLQLLEEIEVIARKFDSDYNHVLGLARNTKTLPQLSKMGTLHSRNHIPSLKEIHAELVQHSYRAVDRRNSTIALALQQMQNIAGLETDFARVNTQVAELDLPQAAAEALDELSLLSQLPMIYGSLLIEAARREEWADKLRSESAILAEDIAGYREEEERRRKKWLKGFSHLISDEAAGTAALNFELNLQSIGKEWPSASREEISQYIEALKMLANTEEIVHNLSEAMKELDKPSKQQVKKIKGFKMGSIHGADSRKGSFLLRGDDEVKALREINSKLEEELKSQKSRVRKLEDLVYKQGQPPRSTSGNLFQTDGSRSESPNLLSDPPLSPSQSPKPELLSRKASVNTRRASVQTPADDKTLARRIVALEAELHEERQKRAELQTGAITTNSTTALLKAQFEEAQSTNRDLLANMDAQQHEFADERRLLTEEVDRHKLRVEEVEDELDRMIGSRDQEKTGEEEKIKNLERQLDTASADRQSELASRKEAEEEFNAKLRSIHLSLATDGVLPEATADLIEAIDVLIESSTVHQKELTAALATARADNTALQMYLDKHEDEITALRVQVRDSEEATSAATNAHANEKARAESMMADLEDARDQLRLLRAKFAEGETGSEALRQRLAEQASKASTLATQLAQSKSQVISLDVELSNLQRRYTSLEAELAESSHRLGQRSDRDRDLSQRLVTYVEELTRLLETLGLAIVERDGTMSIQRASKFVSASTMLEPNPENVSPVGPLAQNFDVSIDPALTHWMHTKSDEDETDQFRKFTSRIDAFNVGKFSEAVVKLRRDVEWTGKKWKAEARSYRDKFHKAQSEAHDKIAYRSFKEGDLALFLPTRNQATRPWAAFNVGAPHYFLREQDSHKLQHREWLVARISKLDERVVDLSKPLESVRGSDGRSVGESESGISFEDDNPFELSDGLRWYLLDAAEERSGAPTTPGLGKSTVASVQRVDAKGSIRIKKSPTGHDASMKLNKSLESRRSSSSSKHGSTSGGAMVGRVDPSSNPTPTTSLPVSAAAEELQRVASLTNLSQALRPTSARSMSAAPFVTSAPTAQASSGRGNEAANIADELATIDPLPHSPPRQILGLLSAMSPPRPSWFGRTASATAATAAGAASPPGRSGMPFVARPGIAPRAQSQEGVSTPQHSPSKAKQRVSTMAPLARSTNLSPAKGQQAAGTTWEPLWSLDMSIEESPGKK